jgi:hypothetical protein
MLKALPFIILGILVLMGGCESHGMDFSTLTPQKVNQIADAIYQIEGGVNTHFPYGIKSIKTDNPRKICLNTIKNNWIRWNKSSSNQDFLTYLACHYCPKSSDAKGFINWNKNIHALWKRISRQEAKRIFPQAFKSQ